VGRAGVRDSIWYSLAFLRPSWCVSVRGRHQGCALVLRLGERTLDWNQGGVMVSQVRSRLSRELQR
jgi:hypothetical protein